MYTHDDHPHHPQDHDPSHHPSHHPSHWQTTESTGSSSVANALGLNARLARQLAEVAGRFQSSATLHDRRGSRADARNLLQVLMLEARHGEPLMLRCTGADADDAFAAIAAVLTQEEVKR